MPNIPRKRKIKREQIRRFRLILLGITALIVLIGGAALLYWQANTSAAVSAVMNTQPTATFVPRPTTTPEDVCALTDSAYRLVKDNRSLDYQSYSSPTGKYTIQSTSEGTYLHQKGEIERHRILSRELQDELNPTQNLVFSPDERYATYLTGTQMWLLRLEDYVSLPVATTLQLLRATFWSPDSRRFIYGDSNYLVVIDIAKPNVPYVVGALPERAWMMDWSSDGRYFMLRDNLRLLLYPVEDFLQKPPGDFPAPEDVAPLPLEFKTAEYTVNEFSPDGQYIDYISLENSRYRYNLYAMATGETVIFSLPPSADFSKAVPLWSPDSRHVLLEGQTGDTLWRGIYGIDGTATTSDHIQQPATHLNPEHYLLSDIQRPLYWSDDGSTLYLHEYMPNTPPNIGYLKIWSMNVNDAQPESRIVYQSGISDFDTIGYQFETGNFMHLKPGDARHLYAYSHYGELLRDFSLEDLMINPGSGFYPPKFSPDKNAATVAFSTPETRWLAVVDIPTGHTVVVARDADDMGDPSWSPDGRKIAVTYSQLNGARERVVRLAVANLDTGDVYETPADANSIFNLVWSDDSQQLAYGVWDASGTHLMLLTPSTHITLPLLTDVQALSRLAFDSDYRQFTVWWQDKHADIAYFQAFRQDGAQAYQFKVFNKFKMTHGFPTIWWRHIFDDPTTTSTLEYADLFWSPDRTQALVKTGMPQMVRHTLQLTTPDGREPVVITRDRDGLGNPYWSPDGRLYAYSESYEISGGRMHIMRPDGTQITTFPIYIPVPSSYRSDAQWEWVKCR